MEFVSILEFGASCDDKADNSKAFCEALSGGRNIVVPKGVYKTGPITIKSNTNLLLEEGAVISFIADENLYEPTYTRWEGVNCYAMHPCLLIEDAENVTVSGPGVFDGNGRPWWDIAFVKRAEQEKPESEIEKKLAALNPGYENQPGGGGGRQCQYLRPALFQILRSKNVVVDGIRLQNSPFWTLHPIYTENLTIRNVSIKNPYESPNTDGIDIDSCKNVLIENCTVDVGDDGIAIKSGSGEDGIKTGIPTDNVLVKNCKVLSAHGGIVIGSETAGGIKNISAIDSSFIGTDRGIRIKTRRGRGGAIENLSFKNLEIEDNICPIAINMYYRCGSDDPMLYSLEKLEVKGDTPSIKNVEITNCHAKGSKATNGFIVGLPEMPIDNLKITSCSLSLADKPTEAIENSEMYNGLPKIESRAVRLRNVNAEIKDVAFSGTEEAFLIEDGCIIR